MIGTKKAFHEFLLLLHGDLTHAGREYENIRRHPREPASVGISSAPETARTRSRVKSYLLGNLPQPARALLEDRYLSDDALGTGSQPSQEMIAYGFSVIHIR